MTRFIDKTVTVRVDRPLGSTHPELGFHYPVNYGYVPGVQSGDGEELDAYVLGMAAPVESFTGRCIAVIHRLDDDDDKLVVVPEGCRMTDSDIRAQTQFQEQYFKSDILRGAQPLAGGGERPAPPPVQQHENVYGL